MRISLEWLREYAPLDAPLEALVAALVESGTEVERVHRPGEGVVVARVTSLEPIPEARTPVLLAGLEAGGGAGARVVTGAANLRVGDLVPWAQPGARLPGLAEPLGVRSMFGGRHRSPGMLCSAAELGSGSDSDGILVLERGRPGQPLAEVLPLDVIIEVDVTTNRPDCLCHLGIARELAAALGETLTEPPAEIPAAVRSAASLRGRARLRVTDRTGCLRFAAVVIEGVAVGPSPEWLQRRLVATGLRPVNNVVDVTNYVARELGEPLHAFDLQRFEEASGAAGAAAVGVRRGRQESLLCLDGVERVISAEDIVVCSGDRPVSLAGVIGGAETAVTETTATVLLEAACWDGATIRATSRRLNLRTDASALFEKGLSDTLAPLALERAASLIAQLGGGHVLRGRLDERPRPLPPNPPIEVPGGFLPQLLGYPVDANEAAMALARLSFVVEQEPDRLLVTAPHFRRDVTIPEDVAEEVGRSLGYQRVPSTLPGRRRAAGAPVAAPPSEDGLRDLLNGAGFDEVITYSFSSPALAGSLGGLAAELAPIPLANPLKPEWSVLRTSLLPGVCQALAGNLNRGVTEAAIFEVGRVFWEGRRREPPAGSLIGASDSELPPLPAEPLLLGLAVHRSDPTSAAEGLRLIQSVLVAAARELGGIDLEVVPTEVAAFRPGRSGEVRGTGRPVGLIGELRPDILEVLGLRGRVVVAELDLETVLPAATGSPRYQAPPRFPAIVQDLSLVVPAAAPAGAALDAIRAAGNDLLEAVELYDEYRDPRLGEDRKGWTFRLTFRSAERTLTDAEAQAAQGAIIRVLVEGSGASVRT